MSTKVITVITLVLFALVGVSLAVSRGHSRPSVTATLRVTVTPSEQFGFVAGRANSAMFKYMISKEAGLSPALARKLEVKPVPNTSLIDAKVQVKTREERERFSQNFVAALQGLCGPQAQVTLADSSPH